MKPCLSIVIPVFNEELNISSVLEEIANNPVLKKIDFEVIVVNDGSQDNTSAVLSSLRKRYPFLVVISHEKNLGVAEAFKSGFGKSKGSYICTFPGDGQQKSNDIITLFAHKDEADIICGVRKPRRDSFIRKLNAFLWREWINFFLKIRVKDLDAMKLYNAKVLKDINIESKSAFFDAEILYKAKKKGYRIKEVFIAHYPRYKGKATGNNFGVVVKAFKDFFKFYFKECVF